MSPEAKQRKQAYDSKYVVEHIVQKKLNLNKAIPEDEEMIKWIDSKPNQNQYLKGLVRDDMKKAGK